MGYRFKFKRQSESDEGPLRLSVWEMSKIRDRMLAQGAAFCTPPPNPPYDFTGRHAGPESGIPAYKLSMIDGWFVRPDEIAEALEAIDAAGECSDEAIEPGWKRWVDFLKDAERAGGFLVE